MNKTAKLIAGITGLLIATIVIIAIGPKFAGTNDENNNHSSSPMHASQPTRKGPDAEAYNFDIAASLDNTTTPKEMIELARTGTQRRELLTFFLDSTRFTLRPDREIATLFGEWFDADPEQALSEIELLPDEGLRKICLLEGVNYFIKNHQEIFFVSRAMFDAGNERHSFLVEISGLIAEMDPLLALKFVQRDELAGLRHDAIKSVFSHIAARGDLEIHGIMSLVDRIPVEERATALRAVMDTGNFNLDLRDFDILAESISDESLLSDWFLNGAKNALADGGTDALASRLPEDGVPSGAEAPFAALVLRSLERDHSLSDSVVKAFEKGLFARENDEPSIARALTSNWNIRDARDFLDTIPDEVSTKPEVAEIVADRAVREDSQQAVTWIVQLPVGPTRDRALRPLLTYLLNHGETETYKELSTLLSQVSP